MLDSKLGFIQQALLASGILLIGFSLFHFFYSTKNKYSFVLLLTGTFLLSLMAITLDPFLNTWDEQYHALVGKNLSTTPLHPRLFPEESLPYDFKQWTLNYTWVHKQPWFMWQMALFIKLFGCSEIAIRIPSLICFLFATFCVFKIGSRLINKNVGFIAATLWSTNYFFYALMSGGHSTDQNDIIFICYVTYSIWAFTEYVYADKKTNWIILIGVFAGIAVLTKWLSGLIVFSAFGTYSIFQHWPNIHRIKTYKDVILSFLICVLIAGSWQLYILLKFPVEAKYEFSLISKHFKEVVEDHGGSRWFYFETFSILYGKLSLFFLSLGVYLFYKFSNNKKIAISLIITICVTYIFFTLAKTKMIAFPLICSPIVILCLASIFQLFFLLFSKNKLKKVIVVFSIICVSILFLRIEEIQFNHSIWSANNIISGYRANKIYWTEVFKSLRKVPEKAFLFNCPLDGYIESMFYSSFVGGLCWMPQAEQVNILNRKGYKVCVLDDGNLPNNIRDYKAITVIKASSFNIIKSDTINISDKNNLFFSVYPDKKIMLSKGTDASDFIIDYFEDSTCRIRALSGEYLCYNITGSGQVLANNNLFTLFSRYRLKKEGRVVHLYTYFNKEINIQNDFLGYDDTDNATESSGLIFTDLINK